MATLTLRRAAVTYSRGPKGMKAWQLLLDWLTPAERARLTRAAVGFCRDVQWVRTVARNTHTNTKRCYNKGPVWLITIFLMTRERYISLPFHLGWRGFGGVSCLFLIITCQILPHDPWRYISLPYKLGGFWGGILLIHHHYIATMMILPGPGQTMAFDRIYTLYIYTHIK